MEALEQDQAVSMLSEIKVFMALNNQFWILTQAAIDAVTSAATRDDDREEE